jgi:predicted amidohydrolase
MSEFKVAILQLFSYGLNETANLEKGEEYVRLAKRMDADLVLFPEMWNIGHTPLHESDWDCAFDPNVTKHEGLLDDWLKYAIESNGYFIQHFRKLAKELEIAIGITFLEKGEDNPKSSLLVIDRYGNDCLKYTKVHICDTSLERYLSPGTSFEVNKLDTKTGLITIGGLIGRDIECPESARILALKQAEVILIPQSIEMDFHQTNLIKTRSYENQIGIALCNYAGKGQSIGFSGIAYDEEGRPIDFDIITATDTEGVYVATFPIQKLRKYRDLNSLKQLRKPAFYQDLVK